ncbi:MAG: hypothetical protein ACP5LX_01345 [Nitrososphaeria archaeon]
MDEIENLVNKYFIIEDEFHIENGYEFEIISRDSLDFKKTFASFYNDIKETDYIPRLEKHGSKYILKVVKKSLIMPKNSIYRLLLLIASLGSIILDGYYRLGSYSEYMLAYEAPILAMLALHETSKYIISYLKKGQRLSSYSIPGIPGIMPFMGFITTGTDSTINRDSLFDEAFYPYLAALLGVIIFLIFSFRININFSKQLTEPFLNQFLSGIFNSKNLFLEGSMLGITILFINFLPATSLDGGLLISSLEKSSLVLDLISIIIMSFLGYFVLALAVIFVQNAHRTELLDSVSPLSKGRKTVYVVSFVFIIILFIMFGSL